MEKQFNQAKKQAQKDLSALVKPIYFDGIPLDDLKKIMTDNGFSCHDIDGIYTGNGRTSVPCWYGGTDYYVYLTFTWYRMPSGKLEIVAYIS